MSTSERTYRQLTPADRATFKDLLSVFGEAFEDVPTYQDAVPGDAYIARLLAKEHVIAIAALSGITVLGGLVAYVLEKFEQDRREVYIYDLAVAEAHRRQGIATGLIETLKQIAASLDAYVIFVQADLVDGPAIALYEKLGTKETAHHFDIAVPLALRASQP